MTDKTVPTFLADAFVAAGSDLGTPEVTGEADGRTTLHWEAEFTPEDEAEFQRVVQTVVGGERDAQKDRMKPHFDVLKAYEEASSPTNAQTQAAVKSLIFVVREMWRE